MRARDGMCAAVNNSSTGHCVDMCKPDSGALRAVRAPWSVPRRCRGVGGGALKNACKLWVIRMPLTAESHKANPNAGLSVSKKTCRGFFFGAFFVAWANVCEKTENATPTDEAPVPAFPQHPSGALIHNMPVSCAAWRFTLTSQKLASPRRAQTTNNGGRSERTHSQTRGAWPQ